LQHIIYVKNSMNKIAIILTAMSLSANESFAIQDNMPSTLIERGITQKDSIFYEDCSVILPQSLEEEANAVKPQKAFTESISSYTKDAFKNLDLGITLGTTGIGIDGSTFVNNWLQVRAGFSFMPKFDYGMTFGVQVGDDPSTSDSKFERLSGMLESFTGYQVDNSIDMVGQPTYWNANITADFFPFRNKNWYLSAGVYIGSSRIAKAFNTTEDMPSLMAVGIYNNLYSHLTKDDPETGLPWYVEHSISEEILGVSLDPMMLMEMRTRFADYGRMGIHVGDYKSDGTAYIMEPDENSMVKAKITANSVKPYFGFGYKGRLLKNNDRYHIGFDCGALLWGGTPSIKTHDGTDLAKDVTNIGGKVGTYVDFFKAFRVFPLLNIHITKTIF